MLIGLVMVELSLGYLCGGWGLDWRRTLPGVAFGARAGLKWGTSREFKEWELSTVFEATVASGRCFAPHPMTALFLGGESSLDCTYICTYVTWTHSTIKT